jgi:hypothetical protein
MRFPAFALLCAHGEGGLREEDARKPAIAELISPRGEEYAMRYAESARPLS